MSLPHHSFATCLLAPIGRFDEALEQGRMLLVWIRSRWRSTSLWRRPSTSAATFPERSSSSTPRLNWIHSFPSQGPCLQRSTSSSPNGRSSRGRTPDSRGEFRERRERRAPRLCSRQYRQDRRCSRETRETPKPGFGGLCIAVFARTRASGTQRSRRCSRRTRESARSALAEPPLAPASSALRPSAGRTALRSLIGEDRRSRVGFALRPIES